MFVLIIAGFALFAIGVGVGLVIRARAKRPLPGGEEGLLRLRLWFF